MFFKRKLIKEIQEAFDNVSHDIMINQEIRNEMQASIQVLEKQVIELSTRIEELERPVLKKLRGKK